MFEFGFALLGAIFIAALMIVLRRLRSFKRRLDQLVRQYNELANRVLLLTLNRVQADTIVPPLSALSIASGAKPGSAQTEIGGAPIRLVDTEGLAKSEHPSESPPFSGREPRRYQ
jgi:hypothetical protein